MDLGDGCFLSTPELDDENPFNQNFNTGEDLSNSQRPTQPLFGVIQFEIESLLLNDF